MTIGRSKGGASFWQKICKIIPIWELAHPPRENPGSPTDDCQLPDHLYISQRITSIKGTRQCFKSKYSSFALRQRPILRLIKYGLQKFGWRSTYCTETLMTLGTVTILSFSVSVSVSVSVSMNAP